MDNINDKIQLFEDKKIRTAWDEENEEWYFSIIDVISVSAVTNLSAYPKAMCCRIYRNSRTRYILSTMKNCITYLFR